MRSYTLASDGHIKQIKIKEKMMKMMEKKTLLISSLVLGFCLNSLTTKVNAAITNRGDRGDAQSEFVDLRPKQDPKQRKVQRTLSSLRKRAHRSEEIEAVVQELEKILERNPEYVSTRRLNSLTEILFDSMTDKHGKEALVSLLGKIQRMLKQGVHFKEQRELEKQVADRLRSTRRLNLALRTESRKKSR